MHEQEIISDALRKRLRIATQDGYTAGFARCQFEITAWKAFCLVCTVAGFIGGLLVGSGL